MDIHWICQSIRSGTCPQNIIAGHVIDVRCHQKWSLDSLHVIYDNLWSYVIAWCVMDIVYILYIHYIYIYMNPYRYMYQCILLFHPHLRYALPAPTATKSKVQVWGEGGRNGIKSLWSIPLYEIWNDPKWLVNGMFHYWVDHINMSIFTYFRFCPSFSSVWGMWDSISFRIRIGSVVS